MPAYNPWTSLLEAKGAAHKAVAAYGRQTRKGEGTSGGSQWQVPLAIGNIRWRDRKRKRDIRCVLKGTGTNSCYIDNIIRETGNGGGTSDVKQSQLYCSINPKKICPTNFCWFFMRKNVKICCLCSQIFGKNGQEFLALCCQHCFRRSCFTVKCSL